MKCEKDPNTFDLSPLLSGETDRLPFQRSWDEAPEQNGIQIRDLSYSGEAKSEAEEILLTGTLSCTLHALCARCLAPVSAPFEVETAYVAVKEEPDQEEDRDVVQMEGEAVDLYAAALEALALNMPVRLLCREDCKGLCPKCGKDLNQGECSCETKEVDPRLAGLADFFK